MLTNGFRIHPHSIVKKYYTNSNGIILDADYIDVNKKQFSSIVSKLSVNVTPFSKIRITYSGTMEARVDDREINCRFSLIKTDKKTIVTRTMELSVYPEARFRDIDVTDINEHVFLYINPYFNNRLYITHAQFIVRKIEFIK
ncbi:hypothetical protein [Clostridium sp. E02]|uniref:hypothetical protein n=1 Tax=Clostridium sp. E02 TaxID=2487134 RepID=UPI0019D09386|nr:hypothetical protein [Clostridium sp. E02]